MLLTRRPIVQEVFMQALTLDQATRLVATGNRAIFVVCICLALCASGVAPVKASDERKKRSTAERALRNGDFDTAARLFREVLVKHPKDANARLRLSFALLKLRELQDAFDQAARVLAAEPNSARAYALLGSALLAVGNFKDSITAFRTSLTLDENESMAIAGLAMINFYESLGRKHKRFAARGLP